MSMLTRSFFFVLFAWVLCGNSFARSPKTQVNAGFSIYSRTQITAAKPKTKAGRKIASTATANPIVFSQTVSDNRIPVNFYLFCVDPELMNCATVGWASDYAPAQFQEIVGVMSRLMNFDGQLASLNTRTSKTGFALSKVMKVYRPEYFDIGGSLEETVYPPSDPTLEAGANGINVYVVNSAPYCGLAFVGQPWQTARGSSMTLHGGCLGSFGAELRQVDSRKRTTFTSTSFGDTSFSHELMHAMGSDHTADYWGGTGDFSGCGTSYSWSIRRVDPSLSVSEGHNIMSYDALSFVWEGDANRNGIYEYHDGATFAFESLKRPGLRSIPASTVMASARNCYLRKK